MPATPRQVLLADLTTSWQGSGRPPTWLQALAAGAPEARETVRRGLHDFYQACVAPSWDRITAVVRGDIAERIPTLATHGLGVLFGTLNKDLAWRDNALERSWRSSRTCELSLDGHGITILPSALWTGTPLFSLQTEQFGGNALIYPASPSTPYVSGEASDLAALLGRTRAATLLALREPCSTLELAAVVQVSASSASEHAKALRTSGLVQTARSGRSVRHSLTPLGRSLLSGQH